MRALVGPSRVALIAAWLGVALAGCSRESPQQADAPRTTPPASTAGAPTELLPDTGRGTASDTAGATGSTEDSALAGRVKSALESDATVGGSDIVVEARQGDVLLSGFVRSQDQIDTASRVAEGVDGVKQVTNRINVNATAGTPGYPPGGTTGGSQDAGSSGASAPQSGASAAATGDSSITTKVKSALLSDPEVRGTDIVVETREGEVLLSGTVQDAAQIDRAVKVAKDVEGVKKVTNKMTVKKS